MDEKIFKYNVTCPQCNTEFEVDARIKGSDDDLHCPSCGFIFSIESNLKDSLHRNTKQVAKEIKRKIREAEKGNIKISSKELNEMKNLLAKHKF